jgi:hypothetical protein
VAQGRCVVPICHRVEYDIKAEEVQAEAAAIGEAEGFSDACGASCGPGSMRQLAVGLPSPCPVVRSRPEGSRSLACRTVRKRAYAFT